MLATACHGLQIAHSGSPLLGDAMHFELPNTGTDVPGFAFGWPAAIPIALCPPCSLGLRLDAPIDVLLGSTTLTIAIPPIAGLVNQSFAVQGLGGGSGTCFGAMRLSDTVAFTIR